MIFDAVYRKLEAELQKKREAMQEVLAAAERAYRAREAAQGRISRLRAEASQESAAFDRQWRDAARRLEEERAQKQTELAALRALGDERLRLGLTSGPGAEAEKEARAKVARGRWTLASDRMSVEAHEDRMAQFQRTMDAVRVRRCPKAQGPWWWLPDRPPRRPGPRRKRAALSPWRSWCGVSRRWRTENTPSSTTRAT